MPHRREWADHTDAEVDVNHDADPEDAPDASTDELTATLLVGDFESRCGNCNKPTLLHGVHRHTDISGWQPQPGAGCGARFVSIASLSRAVPAARLRELRPDLPVRAQHNNS
ncbi:hypothetical protein ACH4UR_37640 [Streptomyces lydicus]|uniref:hypothetical protein n=1 Tax=Streptomyces lydicus TaxID=47763 RepID=UPI0033CC80AA